MMRIALMGTGRMARQLGLGWAKAGHEIVFGSRRPEAKAELQADVPGARVVDITTALDRADVVVIAMPFTAVASFAQEYAAQLGQAVVIDLTNPFGRLPENGKAGAEITAEAIGPGARVVAAFKGNFWETLLEPVDPKNGLARDVHLAGDGAADKEVVSRLIEDLGFRPVDCGALRNARVLDGMVPLIVELDRRYANGERRASWRLLS
jgi:NADPH-dependent F420 reductase